jgi:starvation-inducible outer membrane lipoprotein
MKPVISVLIQRSACIFSIMVICFYLAGCASPPPMIQEPVKRYFEVDTSLDTVWKSSVQALVEKGSLYPS